MEPIFVDNFTVSDLQCDRFGRLKPSAILWFVQEIAGRHCRLLGVDWDTLVQKRMFWAIIRHRLQINCLPKSGSTIRVETWPMPTTRTAYPRMVLAFDQDGQLLFSSLSLWVLMEKQSRAMILPGKSGVEVPGILRGCELPMPKSLAPAELENETRRTVCFTDLDCNGHMNNCRYLDWAYDLLPSAFHSGRQLSDISLVYLNEAREGDVLHCQYQTDEAGLLRLQIHRQQAGDRHLIFRADLQFT
jgi:acyl-ACP thioesterase